jgi:toxin-antitoxin system PIN domain toxin
MIAVDTNILVYSQRSDSPWHAPADACLTSLAESGAAWAIPWPCLHEFLAIVTNPRIYQPATALKRALEQVECWLECPSLQLLSETGLYWEALRRACETAKVHGGSVHDARIAALCVHHGVRELWTADRDFMRFPGLRVVNPLPS